VPAGNRVSSLTGASASAQKFAVAFTTTQWSLVLSAQGKSPSAQEALEKLCRTYWWPLYGFVRRQGCSPEEAQDLTQGFLPGCSKEEIWTLCAAKRDVCARIFSRR